MRNERTHGRASLVAAMFLVLVMIIALTAGCCVRVGTAIHIRCQEDESCWDCHTMGNRICGTTTTTLSHAASCALGDEFPDC